MSEEPWYSEGLRFECSGCGDCCTGAPGHVWVNKAEIADIAKAIGETDIKRFEKRYVIKVGARKSLRELPDANYDCVFLDPDTRKCQVYHARPRQCKTWPFWGSNIESPDAWKETCEVCPGSGVGKLYDLPAIVEQRDKVRM